MINSAKPITTRAAHDGFGSAQPILRSEPIRTRPRIEKMNFDDTPQEAAFRSQAKAWIAAHAPRQYEEELKKSSLGRTQLKCANILEVAKALQKKKADSCWACLHWPNEY